MLIFLFEARLTGAPWRWAGIMCGAPSPPPAPPPPDYAAANREAIYADINTLEARRRVEQAAKLGTTADYFDPQWGHWRTADFRGLGDKEIALQQAQLDAASADVMAKAMLDIQKKYGPEFVKKAREQLEMSDPEGFRARIALGDEVMSELSLGSKLSDAERREVEQAARRAQTSRGNIMGNAPATAEAMEIGEAGRRRYQERLSNVGAFLAGTPPTAQFASITGAQEGAAPFRPVAYQPGINIDPGAGALGTSFAASTYGTQMSGYNAGLSYRANAKNPWMEVAGLGLGAVAGVASKI